MGVDPTRLGNAIATALQGISVPQDAFIDSAFLSQVWIKVSDEIDKEYTANAEVEPGSFVVNVPSFGTHSVTGLGGPVK